MVGEAAHGQLRLHSVAQSAGPVSIEEGEGVTNCHAIDHRARAAVSKTTQHNTLIAHQCMSW